MGRWGLALLLIITFPSAGQEKYDTAYIKSYKDKFFVWPVAKRRELSFVLQEKNQSTTKIEFKPNNAYALGLGVYLFDLGLEIVFPMPVAEEKESLFGSTRATDVQLNMLSRRWGGDIVYQRYKGYYLTNPQPPLQPDQPHPQRPDIVTENLGINGIYAFNSRHYSLRSSFTFADRQLKSAGGFVIAASYNQYQIEGDSAILNPYYRAYLGQTQSFNALNFHTYALAPGYGYNLVTKSKIFVSALLALGPAIEDFRFRDANGVLHKDTRVDAYVDLRAAIGYSNDRFFTAITISRQARNVAFEDVMFSSVTTTGRILFGWRFPEKGFLTKSVWDLLPPWGRKSSPDQ